MKTYAKFAVLVVVIIGTLTWLAAGGINETKTYYKTISEVHAMGNDAYEKRIRVGGDVKQGSIVREGKAVRFTITQDAKVLHVIYDGTDPLPDTFRDGSQALADGKLMADGTFRANKIQAKCASKYEAKPTQKLPVQQKQASL
jgi:cytochrome c-type biogenesis protein CcmE